MGFITVKDTVGGNIDNIQILGNTWQNPENLAEIVSSGVEREDGTFEMSILSSNGLEKTDPNYLECRNTISLPCQLEKVGDVADRLYDDDIEKAWCVYKNVINYVVNGNEKLISIQNELSLINSFELNGLSIELCKGGWSSEASISSKLKCVPFSSINSRDEECFAMSESNGKVNIRFNVLKSKISTLEDFKVYIVGTLFKYQAKTPQKIILPLNTQLTLNSYFGTTHLWSETGKVDVTIKGSVPKSTQASLQSLHNKTDILDDRLTNIEGLKESQNMVYESNSGYIVAKATQNGVVKDINLQGRTLVNYSNVKKGSNTITKSQKVTITPIQDLTGKKVRLICNCTDLNVSSSRGVIFAIHYTDSTPTEYITFANTTKVGIMYNDFVIKPNLRLIQIYIHSDNLDTDSAIIDEIMLIDDIDNNLGYFEGMQSVGEDVSEIEVSSRKEDGNLFDGNIISNNIQGGTIGTNNISCDDFIKLDKGNYSISNNMEYGCEIHYYDSNKKFVRQDPASPSFNIDDNTRYIKFRSFSNQNNLDVKYCINKGTQPIPYEPYQGDKKAILYRDKDTQEWLPMGKNMPLHEWDEVNSIEGKLYKRSGKRVYAEGDESKADCITDMTNTVYKLATEEVYDISPIEVDAYAHETMLSVSCGAISPKATFAITSHINELVKQNRKDIKLMQDEVYKYMVAQNRLQLASTYSADSVTFKVDYQNSYKSVTEGDADLYKLIENNILVGKENYDYDRMFMIIMDYASWSQITWEQFDILLALMDYQHNPPTEEIPVETPVI